MDKDKNELYKDVALEVSIDAKKGARNQEIETHATFYSYDVQSGLIKINIKKDNKPLSLPNGTQVLLNVVKLDLPQQKMVFTGDIVDSTGGSVYWVIPDELQGYKGAIRTGVFIKLPNDQRLHGGYFKFNMGISEIDENLVPFEENYWQGWDTFQKEAEQEWNAWKASRDKTWREHEEAYDEWKKQQENKQSDFESNFVSWKYEQKEKQTDFERDFADWKNTQETKQTNFESETSQKITDINQTLKITDSQVQETNNALENLDAYTKVETDEKLNDKADKSELNDTMDNFTEHGFLELKKGFENYENSGEIIDEESYYLQYIRVGPLCHVFGSITNKERLEERSSNAIATMPDHLKVVTRDVKVSQGSQNNTFTTTILGNKNPDYPNMIVVERLRDNNGNDTGYNAGKYLNISLTFTVEVVK